MSKEEKRYWEVKRFVRKRLIELSGLDAWIIDNGLDSTWGKELIEEVLESGDAEKFMLRVERYYTTKSTKESLRNLLHEKADGDLDWL